MNTKQIFGIFALLIAAPFAAQASSQLARDGARGVAPESPVSESTQNSTFHPDRPGSYYDWGRGQNGWGYCYEWTYNGQVLNGGRPVANDLCEAYRPSSYNWERGMDGWGYCYQWTPYGVAMNEGRPVQNYSCESVAPSHYAWARANDGYVYCFQFTPSGIPMNQGRPVPNYYCR